MLHAYDPATGAIKQIFTESNPSEVSRLEALGYTVTPGPMIELGKYRYDDGALTQVVEDLEAGKAAALARLQADYQAYSDSRYSLAWQSSAREFRDTAKDIAGSSAAADEQKQAAGAILQRLVTLQGWLFKGIMVYYATKAGEIKAAADEEALDAVNWDFKTLDASDPQVSITDELYPLLMVALGEQGAVE